jgi:hypothetical protein
MFTSEPQPVIDGSPQIVVMFMEEARRPVRVASAGEWVVVPSVDKDRGGFGHVGHLRIHGVEDAHQFLLDFLIGLRLDAPRPVAL